MDLKKRLEIIARADRIEPVCWGIRQSFWDGLCSVFASHPSIEAVVLFGSRARGTHRKGSDVDLCVLGREFTFDDRLAVMDQIDELWWPYHVDVIHWESSSSPVWRQEVRLDAQLVYNRDGSDQLPPQLTA